MKKRGFFFVALVLSATNLVFAADQNYTDLGTAQTLEVTESKLSEAQVNTGSTVTVITREQIEAYHAETTADLLEKAIGVSRKAYGAIGALANANIRGMGIERTLMYIDGMPVGRAYYGVFDLSTVPTSIIDHVEIIKTGSGSLNGASSFGGIVNIVTKKAADNKEHYEVSFENGSFLPKEYKDTDGDDERNWRGLVDSQKGEFTYSNNFNGVSLLANVGGYYADNGYVYENTYDGNDYIRENNEAYDIHGNVNASGSFGDGGTWQSNNRISYQRFNVPGQLGSLSPENYQVNFNFTTTNQAKWDNATVRVSEEFNNLKYHSEYSDYYSGDWVIADDKNKSNTAAINGEYLFTFNEDASLTAGGEFTWDYLDTTSFDEKKNRVTPKAYVNGAFYFLNGKLGLYPMLSLAYVSDYEKLSPNATLGLVYSVIDPLTLNASFGYVSRVPMFYQLYDPYMGNEDLDLEQGFEAEVGGSYTHDYFAYEASVFAKYLKDAIAYDETYVYKNIDESFFVGTEQSIKVFPVEGLTLSASYLLNKSYDLSDDNDLGDDIWVTGVRMNTAKLGVSYNWEMLTVSFDANYYGKYKYFGSGATEQSDSDDFWVCNAAVSANVMEGLTVYGAIDNLFDKDYQFSNGYPMPGMKIRLGGTWKF